MNRVRSYDLETGKVIWEAPGTTMNPIPSPVAADGMVFAMSGFRGNNLKAIHLAQARGDLTGTSAIAWTLDRDTPYVPRCVAGARGQHDLHARAQTPVRDRGVDPPHPLQLAHGVAGDSAVPQNEEVANLVHGLLWSVSCRQRPVTK